MVGTEADRVENPDSKSGRPLTRRRLVLVCVAILSSAIIIAAILYWPASPFRERTVSYDYTVDIDGSDVFVVVCPLPADYLGVPCPDFISDVVVLGDAAVSLVSTLHGEGMEIQGSGQVTVTWTHVYTYRSSTQSYTDHYSNLSMLSSPYDLLGSDAFVSSNCPNVILSLVYDYSHVYGNLGADYLSYEMSSILADGWNTPHVSLSWAVS